MFKVFDLGMTTGFVAMVMAADRDLIQVAPLHGVGASNTPGLMQGYLAVMPIQK